MHDWKPEGAPPRLFHGSDDRTVPYAAAVHALLAMRWRGVAQVSLTGCPVVRSSRRNRVAAFLEFTLAEFVGLARGR
jgi:hypothetical protein